MKEFSSKQAQVQTITPAVLALTLAAVVLVFGIIITQELRDVDMLKYSTTVGNETLTTVSNLSVETVAYSTTPGFSNFAVIIMTNATDGVVIQSGNYTINAAAGTVIATVAGTLTTFNNTNWNVTYSYDSATDAYIGANATVIGFATFGDFWEIIVLAIVISVVIGLLLIVFGQPRRQR